MKIRSKFLFNILLLLVLIILSIITTGVIHLKSNNLFSRYEETSNLEKSLTELNIINYKYLMYHETRMISQWKTKYTTIKNNLKKTNILLPVNFIKNIESLGEVFSVLASKGEISKQHIKELSQEELDAQHQVEDRLTSQILMKTQKLLDEIQVQKGLLAKDMQQTHDFSDYTNLTLLILIGCIIILSSIITDITISRSLKKLTKAAELIGSGDLDSKIEIKTKDEIGFLSNSINKMATSLKKITTSKEFLDKAVKEKETLFEREKLAKQICAQLNNFTHLKPTIQSLLLFLNKLVNCDAIGIRLKDGNDYPYFVYYGFSESFIQKESSLCSRDSAGNCIKNKATNEYLLDCMCGNIIRGRFDPKFSFFTEGGSFWSNYTTKLLAETSEEERQSRTRNYCNSCGYESVALIPIKVGNERIGLIQLNNKDKNKFDISLIEFIEMIGVQIGIAIKNNLSFQKLEEIKTKLADSNKELDQFAYSASHDLQAPLRKLKSFSDLLEAGLIDKISKENKVYLDAIKRSTEKMSGFISKLLEYSRLSNQEVEFDIINLNKLLDSIVLELEPEIKEKEAKIKIEKLPEVHGIPIMLQQLFQNLISNALKYHCKNKNPYVSIYSLPDKKEYYSIAIEDNGIGISEENLEKIFQPFKRLHNNDKYQGSGIGLATCRKIMKKHKGFIKVEKNPSGGTCFIVKLPKGIFKK